jgi:type II secretory pathway pseudopilin PulG
MHIRNFALAGAAIVMAAATIPAMAGVSTRAERETTRQLNLEAAQQAQQTNMQAPQMADASAPLSSIVNPPSKIANANLLDSSGKVVGAVQKVEIATDGTATSLDVALIGRQEHMVTLSAQSVSYDAARNEILAQVTSDQLKAMPRS